MVSSGRRPAIETPWWEVQLTHSQRRGYMREESQWLRDALMAAVPILTAMRVLIGFATAKDYNGAVFRLFSTLGIVFLGFLWWEISCAVVPVMSRCDGSEASLSAFLTLSPPQRAYCFLSTSRREKIISPSASTSCTLSYFFSSGS